MSTLTADALAATLNMVERAVCLFKSAPRTPGVARTGDSYLPERFEPTVAARSMELFSCVASGPAAVPLSFASRNAKTVLAALIARCASG